MTPAGTAVGGLVVTRPVVLGYPFGAVGRRERLSSKPPPGGRTGGVGGGAPDLVYPLAQLAAVTDSADGSDGTAVNELPTSCSRPHGPRRTVDSLAARTGPELRTAVLGIKGSENFLNAPSGSLSLAQELLTLIP
jgi:hypothetical protein